MKWIFVLSLALMLASCGNSPIVPIMASVSEKSADDPPPGVPAPLDTYLVTSNEVVSIPAVPTDLRPFVYIRDGNNNVTVDSTIKKITIMGDWNIVSVPLGFTGEIINSGHCNVIVYRSFG